MKKIILLASLITASLSIHVQADPTITTNYIKIGNERVPELTIDGVQGFQDTPLEPGTPWHVHDPARPQPPVVATGEFSQNAPPPSDAIVLFDGKDLSQWRDSKGRPAPWKIQDGAMVATKSDIVSTQKFGDMQLHIEFYEPPAPGNGQDRGNSGVFLMGKFEVQVLDCYHSKTYPDGMTGALYGQHPPLANACRPPGQWETYDIAFTAPRFNDDGSLKSPAYATVFLNGVLVQDHQAFRGDTNWRSLGKYTTHDSTGPLGLQYHSHPVRFRNIWVRPLKLVNEP
jgi:hypothetical protein